MMNFFTQTGNRLRGLFRPRTAPPENRPPETPRPTRNWIRIIFLANLTLSVVVSIMFLFGLRIMPINNFILPEPLLIALAYLTFFLLWLVLENSRSSEFLSLLYANAGQRWYDVFLLIIGVAILFLARRFNFDNLAFWVMGIALIVNSALSLLQIRPTYTEETLRLDNDPGPVDTPEQPAPQQVAPEDTPTVNQVEPDSITQPSESDGVVRPLHAAVDPDQETTPSHG